MNFSPFPPTRAAPPRRSPAPPAPPAGHEARLASLLAGRAGPAQRRFAFGCVAAYAALALLLAPLAGRPGPAVPGAMTVLTVGLLVADLCTAFLLLAQFRESRARSLLPLVGAYLFTATMMAPQLLAFPGAVVPGAPLLGNGQTAGWTWLFWHTGFPAWALAAVALEALAPGRAVEGRPSRAALPVGLGAVAGGGALAVVALLASRALPPLLVDGAWTAWNDALVLAALLLAGAGAALVLLLPRLRANALFLWLAVALAACVFDVALSVLGGGRYTVGWYAGRVGALLSGLVLLALLLAQFAAAYRAVAALAREAAGASESATREKARAERALVDSEARLRTATDNARVGLVVVGADRRYRFANRAYAEILGLPTHEIVGRRVADVLAPMYEGQIGPRLDRAFGGERVEYELTKPAPPGGAAEAHFAVTYEPGRDAAGGPVVVVVITDVTERTVAARALAEGGRMLRLALDAADLGVWRWEVGRGTDGLEWDARCKALFGLPPDARVDYAAWANAIPPEDRAEAEAGVARALDPADPRDDYVCEYRAVRPDGRALRLAAEGRAFFEPDPAAAGGRRAVRIMGIIRDVTEARRAEEERRRTEALLRAFVEAVPGVVYAKDRQGRMLVANAGAAALIGKRPEEFLGKTDAEFLDDAAQAEAVMRNDRRVMERGAAEQVEEAVALPDGTPAVWLSTKAPFKDEAGGIVGLVGSSVDITGHKRAEERLRLMVNELNHRVKNTLATVQSIAGQTLRGADPALRRALEDRLVALAAAHDVLTREHWAGAGLDDVVDRAVAPFGGRGGRLRASGPPVRLQPRAALALAMGLHELATNALKYGALSETAGRAGRVEVRWEVAGGGGAPPRFRLAWAERGGPPVAPPARRGFGTRLVQRSLAQDLGGTVALDFAPGGVACTMDAPLTEVAAAAEAAPLPRVGGTGGD